MQGIISIRNGAEWEKIFFGCSSKQFPRPQQYKSLHEAIDIVAKSQSLRNWNPDNPPTAMGKRLFKEVKHHLRPKDAHDLKLYCAIGFEVDWFHRADGFFRVRSHVVFFDLTTRNDKVQRTSVILKESDKSLRRMDHVARKIAHTLTASIDKDAKLRGQPPKIL